MTYQELYDRYQKLDILDNDLFGIFTKAHVIDKFESRFHAELDALHKEIYPRRRKIQYKNIPKDRIEPIKVYWQERAIAWLTCAKGRLAYLKEKMHDLAQTVELIPVHKMSLLDSVSSTDYGSQGYGAHRYAKNHARITVDLLCDNGLFAEIRERPNTYNVDIITYEVYGQAKPWQLDACRRKDASLLDLCVKLWKRGINPKVYNPFLSDDIFDRSCNIAMGVKEG